jgi:hypothetical protein
MLHFFQTVFLVASIVVIVLNVLEYNKWQEGRKEGSTKPYPIKWVSFIISSLVALGCALNVIIWFIR